MWFVAFGDFVADTHSANASASYPDSAAETVGRPSSSEPLWLWFRPNWSRTSRRPAHRCRSLCRQVSVDHTPSRRDRRSLVPWSLRRPAHHTPQRSVTHTPLWMWNGLRVCTHYPRARVVFTDSVNRRPWTDLTGRAKKKHCRSVLFRQKPLVNSGALFTP